MIPAWAELSTVQRRLLVRLAPNRSVVGSIGVDTLCIAPDLLAISASLRAMGLVERSRGPQGGVCLRMTKAGKKVRDSGRT